MSHNIHITPSEAIQNLFESAEKLFENTEKFFTNAAEFANSINQAPSTNFFAKRLHAFLSKMQGANILLIDPQGTYQFSDEQQLNHSQPLKVVLKLNDMQCYRDIALNGTNGAAEAYLQGRWKTDDLTTLIRVFARNRTLVENMEKGLAKVASTAIKFWHRGNKNTKSGSRRNISAHYDLGNEFFKLFLDERMMYSSYLYNAKEIKNQSTQALHIASKRKLQRICDQLNISANDHVMEIGTGWGGFAIYAAETTGCKVTTTTISKEQHQEACRKVAEKGLENQVTVLLEDYRDLYGQYDKLVSIEMIEAVGHHYLGSYFSQIDKLLRPDGQALIQAITIEDNRYHNARKDVDFIKRYIFPGGFLPSISEITRHAGSQHLIMENLFDMGLSYAKTLRDWRTLFFEKIDAVRAQNFDERFIRMWEYYLCYCEGGFEERAISVVQAHFRKNEMR